MGSACVPRLAPSISLLVDVRMRYASVQSLGLPSGCQQAECGYRELVPRGHMFHARYQWRQHRSRETSVRELGQVAHQDGLARLETLRVVSFR